MMSLFERRAYQARREGKALTADRLEQIWLEENTRYFGETVALPAAYARGWSYVPHFIVVRFYTYAYAFARLVAIALAERRGSDGFAERYLAFLSAGGSESPAALLRPLGVEITDAALWREGYRRLSCLVDEAELLSSSLELPLGEV